ncbi:MAG: DUF2891 domain-containing protein [Cyclobacteriaceae bacterium]
MTHLIFLRKKAILILIILGCHGCTEKGQEKTIRNGPVLDSDKAEYLHHFAFDCIDQEYPNKLGQTLGDSTYLAQPHELHPAFYGCFDWHSAVHGHWTLVNLLRLFPDFEKAEAILQKLETNITSENIRIELEYFDDPHNKSYERTYGWVWLFKLAEALNQWDHSSAEKMAQNIQLLVDTLEVKMIEFLPKLSYPIRVGEHPNTAFALSFALDYARSLQRSEFEQIIISRAKEYYLNDKGCPITWEPGGFDFLSPCLQEASLMAKVLPSEEFKVWINRFMPGLLDNPAEYMQPVSVTDKSDGKLAHLDGLNFSRAWCLYEIGYQMDKPELVQLANDHFNASYDKMDAGEYAGSHWLASFALYALIMDQWLK